MQKRAAPSTAARLALQVYDTLQIQPGDPWITSFWIEIIIAVDRFVIFINAEQTTL